MPRKSRDTDLSTTTARRRLKPKANRAPYYRSIAHGQFLGYRRTVAGPGTWTARLYQGDGRYLEAPLGAADDEAPADGSEILSYSAAVIAALDWCRLSARPNAAIDTGSPLTVDTVMADYLNWYRAHKTPKGYASARVVVSGSILPRWKGVLVVDLTTADIRRWHQDLAASPARFRPGPAKQKTREASSDPDVLRKRKATANRILTVLRAGLNFGVAEGRVPPELAPCWRAARPFKAVDKPRLRFFTIEEVNRLLNSCGQAFKLIVTGALLTGGRWGELTDMNVRDFSAATRSVSVSGKTGARVIFLNEEGIGFFSSLVAGRAGEAPMFARKDGGRWARSQQARRMGDAVAAANIPAPNNFHILRHTYASHYLMNGGDLPGLSKQLGHSDTRMTIRTYAHLASAWRQSEAAAHAPTFGITPASNVTPLRRQAS
jgi:integrase